jgi:hypothetical protein
MGLNELISKVTDPYERQARLWPALLTILPLIITIVALCSLKISIITNIVMLAASCGGIYLLTNTSREIGKRLELKLFKKWGGKPTTILLRHQDDTIESATKRRYHAFLSSKIKESFPNNEQEIANSKNADDLYQSAIRWLLNQTRDTKQFSLLFQENITYGFRRNSLGLKPLGITISIGTLIGVLLSQDVISISKIQIFNNEAIKTLSGNAIISLVSTMLILIIWIFFFTTATIRTAAFTYAETLLRSCDILEKQTINKSDSVTQTTSGADSPIISGQIAAARDIHITLPPSMGNSLENEIFDQMETTVPDLLLELRKELKDDPLIRDIIFLERKSIVYGWPNTHLMFSEEEYKDIRRKLQILVNADMIQEIKEGFAFRITEKLARYLR